MEIPIVGINMMIFLSKAFEIGEKMEFSIIVGSLKTEIFMYLIAAIAITFIMSAIIILVRILRSTGKGIWEIMHPIPHVFLITFILIGVGFIVMLTGLTSEVQSTTYEITDVDEDMSQILISSSLTDTPIYANIVLDDQATGITYSILTKKITLSTDTYEELKTDLNANSSSEDDSISS